MALVDFPWPPLGAARLRPTWNGTCFQIDADRARVAAYHETASHWSGDLTALHESAAGPHHPIDVASRRLALTSLQPLRQLAAPRILDVGCSSGFVLEELRRALPRADLIGADYLLTPLESLARRMPNLPLLQFDLRQCPLPDACVDGVTCLNVLEHIDDDRGALRQVFRILKPGGLAHVEVPAGPALYDIYDEFLLHHRRYRLGALTAMAKACGFAVTKATHLGALVYPAFWLQKQRNRRKRGLTPPEKSRLVAGQIRATRTNPLLAGLIRLEMTLGRFMAFPFGIRCVVSLTKPKA